MWAGSKEPEGGVRPENALVKPLWQQMRERRASPMDLLTRLGISAPPVDPFKIARSLGVSISPGHYEYEGALDARGTVPVIHVRGTDIPARQRFTVAHEIGHLILHPIGTFFRDERFNGKQPWEEIQANRYAAELLMPALWVREYLWRGARLDELVSFFGVSRAAMKARLEALGAF